MSSTTNESSKSESDSPPSKRSLVIETSSIKPITRQQHYSKSEIQEIKFFHQWTIENFSYFCMSENIKCPIRYSSKFASPSDDNLQFRLKLFLTVDHHLSLFLQLDNCDQKEIVLKYDFWIINTYGVTDNLKSGKVKFSKKEGMCWGFTKFCAIEDILTHWFTPGDVLNIVCEISYDRLVDTLHDLNEIALSQLEEDCVQLSQSDALSDVVLVFGDGEHKKEFAVHAAILGSRSAVFAAMLEHNMKEKNKRRVEITDVDADVGEELVGYLYCKNVPFDSYADVLIPIADKYQLNSLKTRCEDALCFRINADSVGKYLLLADMHNCAVLKSKCIDYIHCHASCLLESKGIQKIKNQMPTRPELYYELFKQIPQGSCPTWSPPTLTSDACTTSWSYASSSVSKCSKLLTIGKFNKNHLSATQFYLERYPHDFIESGSFSVPKSNDNSSVQFSAKLYPHGENDQSKEHLSLQLQLKCDEKMKFAVKVKASIMVNDNSAKGYTLEMGKLLSNGESIGWLKFISRDQLKENDDLLLNGDDDQLLLLCEVFYIENIDKPVTMSGVNTFADEHKFSIARDLSQSYTSQKLTDIVFVFGHKKLHAHKSIVSARSSVFARMFKNKKQAQIKDVDDVEAFEQMLALVYGQTEALTHWAYKMMPLIDKFELDSLKQVCQIALCDQLDDTNVAQFLLLADKHKATMLKAEALEYIRRKHSVLTQNDSLKEIQQQNPTLFHEVLCYKLQNWKYLTDICD